MHDVSSGSTKVTLRRSMNSDIDLHSILLFPLQWKTLRVSFGKVKIGHLIKHIVIELNARDCTKPITLTERPTLGSTGCSDSV